MSDVTASTVTTLRSDDSGSGSAHFSAVKISHADGKAVLYGFQLDQYELDSYTMWVNEVMDRHAQD